MNINNKALDLRNYVLTKIKRVKDLNLRVDELSTDLRFCREALETAVEQEITDLRKMTGIDHLIGKVSALSRVSNEALIEKVPSDGQD